MNVDSLIKLPAGPREFLRQTDTMDVQMLIREYARYMLDTAGARSLPIDIDQVLAHHGFKQPKKPLEEKMGRRGMQLGRMLVVNTDDPIAVQRFSKGHELTEALIAALRIEKEDGFTRYSPNDWQVIMRLKEHLCDYGAAELLLPAHLFFPCVQQHRVKLKHGVDWARDFGLSLTATIRRMLDANISPAIFLVVQEHLPRYYGVIRSTSYGILWNGTTYKPWRPNAEAQLRVVNEWHSPQTKHLVMLNETVSRDTLIYRSFQTGVTGQVDCANNMLDFEYLNGYQRTETLLVKLKDKPTVMALIHPRDLS